MVPITLFSTTQALLLVTALSMDALVAGFAYGAGHIKIPLRSNIVINSVCSSILAIALLFGNFVNQYIPQRATLWVSFFLLFFIGLSKIFDSIIKCIGKRAANKTCSIAFRFKKIQFLLTVMADSTKADVDCSKSLTCKEAVPLAIALSIDGLAAGFSFGLVGVNILEVVAFSLILGICSIFLGTHIGNLIAEKFSLNVSWFSGLLLIILATLKLA